jgi:ABC-2 type transport system permease protein
MKLLIRDKITVAVFLLASLFFFLICASLNFSAQDRSRIPIGIANLDTEKVDGKKVATKLSQELVDRVKESSSFRVVQGEVKDLKASLMNGEINTIFVINRDYQERIMSGSTKQNITIYKSPENKAAALLSDIFAGEMLDQICLQKSWLKYRGLDFEGYEQLSAEEYSDYVHRLMEEDEFEFTFDVELVSTKSTDANYEKLNNTVLYRQIIAGIFAMLLSFVVLFSFTYVCMEKEQGITRRKQLTLSSRLAEYLGTILAVLALAVLLCIIFVSCICYYADVSDAFWPLLKLSLTYAFVMSVVFILLVQVTRGVISYQMIGAVLILILGLLGFFTMMEGLVLSNLINALENTPNGWFIRRFVDIIVNT